MNMQSMPIEFEFLPIESINLEQLEINQAIELSDKIPDGSRQWETYLNALGLFTFKKWLEEHDKNLKLNWEKSTIAKPSLANLIPNVANLQVGNFKLCLLTIGSSFEEKVPLSRVVVESPEFVPHFYVLVEVLEEQECGVVRGVISYPQLMENIETLRTHSIESSWTYEIPLTWFKDNPNFLLLCLRTLDYEAICLPSLASNIVTTHKEQLTSIKSELSKLLPQLQSPEKELSQVLSWEQGGVILSYPELVEWIYKLQTNNLETQSFSSLEKYLSDLIKLITQPAINIGRWLWDELDEVGKELSWSLLPKFASVRELRSPEEEFDAIKSQLEAQGLEVPLMSRGGYINFALAGVSLRLYATAWNSSSEDYPDSWSLLLIVGAPLLNTLPDNFKFRVSDTNCILVEQSVNPQEMQPYLYTLVSGNWDEKFIVSASLGDTIDMNLPPFEFDITKI